MCVHCMIFFSFLSCLFQIKDSFSIDITKTSYDGRCLKFSYCHLNTCPFVPLSMCYVVLFVYLLSISYTIRIAIRPALSTGI